MEQHSWRSAGNFCPVCSYSHFPFCPPPHFPQYYTPPPPPPPPHSDRFPHHALPPPPLYPPPPPPPPPPQSFYDPFIDPYPSPAQIPPRPLKSNPNFRKEDFYVNPVLGFYDNGQVKRVKYENPSLTAVAAAEDERRLKLIRDHGAAASLSLDRNCDEDYKVFSNNNLEPRNVGDQFIGTEAGYMQESNAQVKRRDGESQFAYDKHWENTKNVGLGRLVYDKQSDNFVQHQGYGNYGSGHKAENHHDFKQALGSHQMQVYENASFQEQRSNFPIESRDHNSHLLLSKQRMIEPKTPYYGLSSPTNDVGFQGLVKGQPPLPNSPPPPLPVELPGSCFTEPVASSSASLFPIAVDSSSSLQSPYAVASQANAPTTIQYSSKHNPKPSDYYVKEIQAIQTSSSTYLGEIAEFNKRHLSSDKPKVIDASLILKHPHRSSRPDHIVIILRGLPGSGKTYLAKLLRDLEVENGGGAPRIHSMDDYFMTEVEKVEESESSKSSGSARGKKPVMKKTMEYFYEPEMEEAYRSSMLKAFKKTLDEGVFSFVIVDDRNLRVADFAQFWATAKRAGYEAYLLEATYKDPAGCAARNVHGFTLNDIHKMVSRWEETPSLYMMIDIKSILHGDDLEENGIQEVDMDTEDGSHVGGLSSSDDTNTEKVARPTKGPANDEHKWLAVEEHTIELVKELGKSKWSNDLEEDDSRKADVSKRKPSPPSDIVKSYSKKGKSLRWADQVGKIGFSIGAGRTSNVSLVIGPGSGYNLKSNPLPEEEKLIVRSSELIRRNIFQQQLRAERESFRAVFDKRRRHRIEADEE